MGAALEKSRVPDPWSRWRHWSRRTNLMAKKAETETEAVGQKLNTKLEAQIDNAGPPNYHSSSAGVIMQKATWQQDNMKDYVACSATSAERTWSRTWIGIGIGIRRSGCGSTPETAKTRTTRSGYAAAIKSFCKRKMALDSILKPPTSHCCLPSWDDSICGAI